MAYDPARYSDSELLEAFASVDRHRYPENFARIQAELEKRGISATSEKKDAIDEEQVNRPAGILFALMLRLGTGCSGLPLILFAMILIVSYCVAC